ncbi:DUF444 family protein [Eubacterium oxidoreducens]|uniref:von Willebrand factor type A domain-containing protein n=1 Tax=Eubacterium oxidoreducens TaxID=1732 RepID=A0A1G6CH25_EUBOX|nr:DUF444 family protein [Eubacterium oxidoreducens]SDB32207.1 von Willebrand factor type A domain-containing protein [Eubacterium oxidoreducens]
MSRLFSEQVKKYQAAHPATPIAFDNLVQTPQFYRYINQYLTSLTSDFAMPIHLVLLHGDNEQQIETSLLDGRTIYVNTDNAQIRSFEDDENKLLCILGYLFHEIAHLRFMDYRKELWAANSFKLGKLPFEKDTMPRMRYPHPDFMEVKSNPRFAKVMTSLYRAIANVISDYHDEEALCKMAGKLVRRGIETVREAGFTTVRSLEDMTEDIEISTLTLLLSAILQYARFGQVFILHEDTAEFNVIMEMLDRIKPDIQAAIQADDVKEKYIQINFIVNKLWRYIDLYIDGPSSEFAFEGTEDEDFTEYRDENERGFHQPAKEEEDCENCDNCDDEDHKEESPGGDDAAEDGSAQDAADMLDSIQNAIASSGGDNISNMPANILSGSMQEIQDSSTNNDTFAPSDVLSGTQEGHLIELSLEELENEIHEDNAEEQLAEQQHKNTLSKINSGNYGSAHTGIQTDIRRVKPNINDRSSYEEIIHQHHSFLKKVQKEIVKIMQDETTSLQRRRMMGRRIDNRHLYKVDQRYFQKKKNPEKELDMAVAILIDNSGSMKGPRIDCARQAAVLLNEVLERLEIPTLISSHNCEMHPVVEIYQQFEDRKIAKYSLMKMQPSGNNRDGLALRMVGELLSQRIEQDKLLIIISDGQPNSNGYSGDLARKDIKEAMRLLRGDGIKTIAFAIGDDKPQIRAIYGEAFVDISDYDKFPLQLSLLMEREIISNIR